jgi:hypothetical protein
MSVDVSPPRNRTGLWLGLGLGLLAIAGVGTAIAFLSDSDGADPASDPDPTPDVTETGPSPISTTDPSDVIVPEGWTLFTSETGVMSYAVDPTWENLLGPGDQDVIHSWYEEYPDTKSEYSGAWSLNGLDLSDSGTIQLFSSTDGTEPSLMRVQAWNFVSTDAEDLEIVLDEEFASAHGYFGWRIDSTGLYGGVLFYESVITLKAGVTLMLVYGYSDQGFESYVPQMLTLTDSIVIHHPPAEG